MVSKHLDPAPAVAVAPGHLGGVLVLAPEQPVGIGLLVVHDQAGELRALRFHVLGEHIRCRRRRRGLGRARSRRGGEVAAGGALPPLQEATARTDAAAPASTSALLRTVSPPRRSRLVPCGPAVSLFPCGPRHQPPSSAGCAPRGMRFGRMKGATSGAIRLWVCCQSGHAAPTACSPMGRLPQIVSTFG